MSFTQSMSTGGLAKFEIQNSNFNPVRNLAERWHTPWPPPTSAPSAKVRRSWGQESSPMTPPTARMSRPRSWQSGGLRSLKTMPTPRDARICGHRHREGQCDHGSGGCPPRTRRAPLAPSTDPGWTHLFMTARCFGDGNGRRRLASSSRCPSDGIPALVSVAHATTRLRDGQSITVDRAAGTVSW